MISIIIPTFNKKKNIRKIFLRLNKLGIVSEVIFVDDLSNDGTINEFYKLNKYKKFKYFIRKALPRDLSKSVVHGITKSKNKINIVMDCDLQHDPSYVKLLFKKFKSKNIDIVIASRFGGENFKANISFARTLASKFAIYVINLIFGKLTYDPLSGFFICNKNLVLKYKKRFFLKGYKILFDILYNSKKNISAEDIKINFKRRSHEKSKFNFQVIWLFFKQILYTKLVVKK